MATSVQDRDQTAPSGVRRAARTGYRWLLVVFLLAVAVQIFLAGLGVFSFGNGDRADGNHAFSAHQGLGFALAGASILLLVLAIVSRAGRLALWLAGALVVQTCLLQSLLDGLADNTAVFGGLHALDGLLIAASAGVQYGLVRRR
jgi:Family of unknown function (DUF6220)